MNIKMNKENWSGEEFNLVVRSHDESFVIHGDRYFVKTATKSTLDGAYQESKLYFEDNSFECATAYRMDEGEWTANDDGANVERCNSNLYVAFAQILFNIV